MTANSAVLISTNEPNLTKQHESTIQYLSSQLTSRQITVKDICILDFNSEILSKKLENYINTSTVVFIIGNYPVICNVLSEIFNEKLVKSDHLTSIYNSKLDYQILNNSKIYQVQNHANGINPVCINFKNIFILPDDLTSIKVVFQNLIIPILFDNCKHNKYGKKFVLNCSRIVSNCIESILGYVFNHLNGKVNATKFCMVNNEKCELNVILSSDNFNSLVNCEIYFKNMLNNHEAVIYENISDSFWEDLELHKNEEHVNQALNVIEECYRKYDSKDVFICFNGGKDCTVLLYLTVYILKRLQTDTKTKLLCLYIQTQNPFPEIEDFIEQCRVFYNLEIVTIKNTVKEGLREILEQKPNLAACLMGTRRTDPFAEHLEHFQMTDPNWPQVMRVSPLLDWNYSNIWDFILICKIPYCTLYDSGYTSLGSQTNTDPNPALKYTDSNTGTETHLPAYELKDGSKERNGRYKL